VSNREQISSKPMRAEHANSLAPPNQRVKLAALVD